MPLTLTPRQLRQRAELYYQLAQLTSVGVTLPVALEQLRRNPPAGSFRPPLGSLIQQLNGGCTFTEALQQLGSWLPAFDIALLQAGEQSGRLDASFRLLADYYRDRERLARQLLADLAYPLFLFHFAVFILPFPQLFSSGDWVRYLGQTIGVLAPLYVITALIIYAAQSRHGETWRSWLESVLRPVPLLGTARHCLALGRLAAALESLLNAGVSIIEAWELAAKASGSPALRRTVLAWRPLVDGGQTPAEVLGASAEFPEVFAHQYSSGEISGKLDETLGRLRQYYQEEGTRKLHALTQWTPRFIYLGVVLLIAYKVVRFYVNYFEQIGAAGGF